MSISRGDEIQIIQQFVLFLYVFLTRRAVVLGYSMRLFALSLCFSFVFRIRRITNGNKVAQKIPVSKVIWTLSWNEWYDLVNEKKKKKKRKSTECSCIMFLFLWRHQWSSQRNQHHYSQNEILFCLFVTHLIFVEIDMK